MSVDRATITVPADARHFVEPPPPAREWKAWMGIDLHGRTFDRLSVLGFHNFKSTKGAAWLVRCTCGEYEIRNAKTLAIFHHTEQMCHVCKAVERGLGQ